MATQTQPGTLIKLSVTRNPTNAAAAKTLSRLFAKDAANKLARRKRKRLLQSAVRTRQRGGRQWAIRPRIPKDIPAKGDHCTVFATPDVLRDLQSLSRFVAAEQAG